MSDLELWEYGRPFLVAEAADTHPLNVVLPPTGSIVVARLHGEEMVEAYDVFEQFAQALRFPVYFGWNWDALSDCLRDMSWLPADRYLIVIDRAEEILVSSAEERETFLSVLAHAAHDWASPLGKAGGEGVAFKVLLLAHCDAVATLRKDVLRW